MATGGFSKERLGRMHDVLAGHVERGEVPGLVSAVSRRGEVHIEVIGSMSPGGNDPIQRDSIFRISSMSKPVAAVATMILIEECKLRLDEPVDRLLPELANRQVLKRLDGPLDETVPANRPITVRDLLTFRMGFGLIMAPPERYPIQKALSDLQLIQVPPNPQSAPDPDEWIRRMGTLPLLHQPGEKWMYGTGANVLGVLIARASGRPLETFLRERLFEPLGMHDTGFCVPESKIDRMPNSYGTNPGTGTLDLYDQSVGGQWSRPPAFPSLAAGLVSTIDDYLAFAQMLLNSGKHDNQRILSRPSVETMTTDQLTAAQKAISGLTPSFFVNHGWGFCVSIVTRRDDVWATPGRYGWFGAMGTSWQSDPKEELITLLMTQQLWSSPSPPDVVLDFWTSSYQAIDD